MKKKAVCMLLGVLLTGTLLTGCGKNKATEAASESAQTEKEGTGERTADSAEDDQKKTDETADTKTDKKAEKGTDAEETGEDASETEENREKIAVLLPDEQNWTRDAKELEVQFEEDGYDPILLYADNDSSKQVSQIQQMAAEEVSAMVIAPVDPYGLADVLADVKDAEIEIPVISYDDLIMNTDGIKYYVTFGGRQVGQMIAKQIIDSEELDKVQEAKESKTIEFFMGSLDDTQALFLYNGVMETLQPYIDDGTLICKSGKTSFDDTGILRWSSEIAKTRMTDILTEYYPDGAVPDIICTGFDDAAMGTEEALEEAGFVPGTENWPLISGAGCNEEGVRRIAEGKQTFSIFMDRRELADQCEEMVNIYLHGEDDPEVNDYEQYDNGIKIIASYLCEPQLIDGENYEILIIENNSTEEATFSYYKELEAQGIRVLKYPKQGFNYSAINNFGVKEAKGEYLLFLNNDMEIITPDFMEKMVSNLQRPQIGAVGAKLYYPDNTVQHAGIIIGIGGIAGHAFLGLARGRSGYLHKASLQMNVSAVTAACMMMKKEVFEEVGGFEEELSVAFNDVDLCLRIGKAGYKIVYNPHVELYHYESKSRGAEDDEKKVRRFQSEIEFMRSRWIGLLKAGDPCYNPNLTLASWNYGLRADGRGVKPWIK